MENLDDLLRPGSRTIGRPGSSKRVREVSGGQAAAEDLFTRLAALGTDVTPPGFEGRIVRRLDGVIITFRPRSKSGPPTIDVKQRGINVRKLKFVGD